MAGLRRSSRTVPPAAVQLPQALADPDHLEPAGLMEADARLVLGDDAGHRHDALDHPGGINRVRLGVWLACPLTRLDMAGGAGHGPC